MTDCLQESDKDTQLLVVKVPYPCDGKCKKNVIFVACDPCAFEFKLQIPYHSSMNYSVIKKHHLVFHDIKSVFVDLKDQIQAGNPKFQYKVHENVWQFSSYIPKNFNPGQKIIAIVETLYP